MIYYSNCKINIGLNVVSRYDDGFHALSTIFYPVRGLRDAIEIVMSDGETEFSSSGIEVDCPVESNLCMKAYSLMKANHHLPNVRIHLHKRVPMGAGIGGGSANAAAVLIGLNDLFNLKLSNIQLIEYSNMLGSDVAFFVENRPMLGEGRGGVLSAINMSLEGYWLTIVKPDCSVSTARAYSMITPRLAKFQLSDIGQLPISKWTDNIINDFEEPIFSLHPILHDIKTKLYSCGALYSSMSGSGSSIYAISCEPLDLSLFEQYGFCYQEKIICE